MLFGKLPESSMSEALADLLEAKRLYELRGERRRSVYLFVALCFHNLDQENDFDEFYSKAKELPCVTIDERVDQAEADIILE